MRRRIITLLRARIAGLAILIANARYQNFGELRNPHADIALVAESLRKIGFEVTVAEDQTNSIFVKSSSTWRVDPRLSIRPWSTMPATESILRAPTTCCLWISAGS